MFAASRIRGINMPIIDFVKRTIASQIRIFNFEELNFNVLVNQILGYWQL